eukprot:CAMPEP_0117660696 /NCGR_PEP_ID=MMETSP0804-20121206/7102_1 /TAXON_ID=1074897 /ORGANISM="Tetraselmis astigmatica, Strain CCMP880" /LENGTH=1030 /DNA_ID=CAMNT_0005467435 /DNA_START=119 /DNA_END=3211 /DNA_ORIENTATION=+
MSWKRRRNGSTVIHSRAMVVAVVVLVLAQIGTCQFVPASAASPPETGGATSVAAMVPTTETTDNTTETPDPTTETPDRITETPGPTTSDMTSPSVTSPSAPPDVTDAPTPAPALAPTASPTPSQTPAPSVPAAVPTPGPSQAPTINPTPAPTAPPAVTPSPTQSPPDTPVPTTTVEPVVSATPTPIPTPTPALSTPTPPLAGTPPSVTPSDTPTPTPTATSSQTASPTPTQTLPPIPTQSPTPYPTGSPTTPPTPLDATATPTPTPTPDSPTEASTPAPGSSMTPAPTLDSTVPPTTTATPTPTSTAAPTLAPTPGPSAAPTQSPTASPTLAPTRVPTPAPTLAPTVVLRSVISLSFLSKAAETSELLRQVQQSLADITNNALVGVTAAEYTVTADDVTILGTSDGSLVVDYEVALPPGATTPDGSAIPPEDLADLSTAALGEELSDTAATSEVLQTNGLPEQTALTVISPPAATVEAAPPPSPPQPAAPVATAAAPLPLAEDSGGSTTPWWHPTQPLMMAILAGVGVLVLSCLVALIVWLCTRRRAKVKPKHGDDEESSYQRHESSLPQTGADNHDDTAQVGVMEPVPPPAAALTTPPLLPSEQAPSWKQPGANVKPRPYKGIFKPFMSNPRPPNMEPYERLVMVSSRVPGAMGIKDAVLSNCAVVVYDWKLYTLQELLGHIKRVLAGRKVHSIGIIAPAGKPGAVGILEGYQTTPQKLQKKPELAQFWRVLAGFVAPQTNNGSGGRLDFLCCRVLEQPAAGAELLRSLGGLLKLSVAASDDPENSFPLSAVEVAPDGTAYAADTGNLAMDLYFDEESMLSALKAVPRALKNSVPMVKARQLDALESPLMLPPANPSVYTAIAAVLKDRRTQIEQQGGVHADQLARLFLEEEPSLGEQQANWVSLLIDLKRGGTYTVQQIVDELQSCEDVSSDVHRGVDDAEVVERLYDYLTANKDAMESVFATLDVGRSGTLDIYEICEMVGMIPGLEIVEVRYILLYLIEVKDANGDGRLSLHELIQLVGEAAAGGA